VTIKNSADTVGWKYVRKIKIEKNFDAGNFNEIFLNGKSERCSNEFQ
jgi:hypothetical protein